MSGREKFKKYKTIINLTTKFLNLFPRGANIFLWNLFNRNKSIIGTVMRYVTIRNLVEDCGENVFIDYDVSIKNFDKLKLGDNVSIHKSCYIDAKGSISIGDNVSIAHNTSIISFEHTWDDAAVPIKYNNLKLLSIRICDDIWIGAGCRILAGVEIGTRSIVSAGAVVTRGIYPGNVILGGIPAIVIKKIGENLNEN